MKMFYLISGALVASWSLATRGLTLMGACWMLFGWGLIALAVIDARTKLLPDVLTLPLMWLGIVMQLFPETRTVGLESSIWGVVAGYVPLWLLAHMYLLLRGRDGLGMGDLKLLAAMGAWSGAAILPMVVFLAALMALIGVLTLRVVRRESSDLQAEFPFGPWIAVAYGLLVYFAPITPWMSFWFI
jgi:leader peptidase (prepilin peptidase)/N-methyltransferase